MIDHLAAFLEAQSRRPWIWGRSDCCLFTADWIATRTGIDGGAPWRGRYRTALGCQRILNREGGVAGVMKTGAMVAGLRETKQPTRAAIAVLDMITSRGREPTGGIALGNNFWAVRTLSGLLVTRANWLSAWEF